jgi:hypothetical protein
MAARGNGAAAGAALGNGGERIAMRMQLKPGMREEYRARHDAIWPELVALLREAGIGDYSIFLHEQPVRRADPFAGAQHRPAAGRGGDAALVAAHGRPHAARS